MLVTKAWAWSNPSGCSKPTKIVLIWASRPTKLVRTNRLGDAKVLTHSACEQGITWWSIKVKNSIVILKRRHDCFTLYLLV
jgi:hypothetical protein